MATFGITPVTGFPPASSEAFPDFIQFQSDGVDLGLPDVDTVDFLGGVATRGTGENLNKVTIAASGGGASNMAWRTLAGDTSLEATDANNAIEFTGVEATWTLTIPSDGDVELPVGCAVLVYRAGHAPVTVTAASGVVLRYRSPQFEPTIAGQYGVVTLIKRGADSWILCGDLAPV